MLSDQQIIIRLMIISPSVFEPMNFIFNLSIEKGIFPDQVKISEVTSLFKKGNNALMDNYLL